MIAQCVHGAEICGGRIAQVAGLGYIDQGAINRAMAEKYAVERRQSNEDMHEIYEGALHDWELNGGRGPRPTEPAYFETDVDKLTDFFNTGEIGILTTQGVVSYSAGDGVDPLQLMFRAGNPSNPLYQQGSYVYGSEGYAPQYSTPTLNRPNETGRTVTANPAQPNQNQTSQANRQGQEGGNVVDLDSWYSKLTDNPMLLIGGAALLLVMLKKR